MLAANAETRRGRFSRRLSGALRVARRELGPPLLPALAAVILQRLAALAPSATERFYARGLYPAVARPLSKLFGLLPFSAGEVLVVAALLLLLAAAARQLLLLGRGRLAWRTRPLAWARFALGAAGAVLLAFMLCFGLNYQRSPLYDTLGYERRPATPEELRPMGRAVVSAINRNYEQAHAGGRAAPTTAEIVRLVEEAYAAGPEIAALAAGGYGPPKPLFFSAALTRAGVGGIYFPFTAEPNFNAEVPDFQQPFLIAHEMAHQRGLARESEASFAAFLVCTRSADPFVRYSGYRNGLGVVGELSRHDPEAARALFGELGPGYREDSLRAARFWARSRGRVGTLSHGLNNLYLKANRIKSGTRNYGEVSALIIGHYLKTPPPAE